MKTALVAPPFLCVPPVRYGGTELFIANLAECLHQAGHEVVVYTIADSSVHAPTRWLFENSQWPPRSADEGQLRDLLHTSWAIQDAVESCDIVHVNSAPALAFSKFSAVPMVYTLHHVHEPDLSSYYAHFPEVQFAAISDFQRAQESMPRMETIHHGIKTQNYTVGTEKDDYLLFLGRFAPVKGAHLAIEVAKKSGIPLKLAGEIQPIYQDYFDAKIKPSIDGKFIEYVGEADHDAKNELLAHARAMLFPIQWNEPFGLVMIESMACGTPVLALPGASVPEVVKNGISGHICATTDEMAQHAQQLNFDAAAIREYCDTFFSVETMARNYIALYERVLLRPNDLPEIEEAVA